MAKQLSRCRIGMRYCWCHHTTTNKTYKNPRKKHRAAKRRTRVISWARKDRNWIFLYPSSCHSEWAELRAKSLSDSLPPGSGRPSVVSLPLYPPEIWSFTMICMCVYIYVCVFPFWKDRPWKHTVYVLNIGCFMAILNNIKPSVMYIYILYIYTRHIYIHTYCVHDIYICVCTYTCIYIYSIYIQNSYS